MNIGHWNLHLPVVLISLYWDVGWSQTSVIAASVNKIAGVGWNSGDHFFNDFMLWLYPFNNLCVCDIRDVARLIWPVELLLGQGCSQNWLLNEYLLLYMFYWRYILLLRLHILRYVASCDWWHVRMCESTKISSTWVDFFNNITMNRKHFLMDILVINHNFITIWCIFNVTDNSHSSLYLDLFLI